MLTSINPWTGTPIDGLVHTLIRFSVKYAIEVEDRVSQYVIASLAARHITPSAAKSVARMLV